MSTVQYREICDKCGKHSQEYTRFFSCRECGLDVCPNCADSCDDETGKALCKECVEVIYLST